MCTFIRRYRGWLNGNDRCVACGPQIVRAQILHAHGAVPRLPGVARFQPELLSARDRSILSAAEPDFAAQRPPSWVGVHDLDGADYRADSADRRAETRSAHAAG